MGAFVSAVIVAAGSSSRMGSPDSKLFISLLKRPAIEYTLEAFQSCHVINEIIVVCREQDKRRIRAIIDENDFSKVTALAKGGATRAESVRSGISAVSDKCKYVAIHDGARPLITSEEIERVVETAFSTGAATLGLPVKDTIKLVDGHNKIESTPLRSQLRAVQTPQVFERELYSFALESAGDSAVNFTDDCSLIENMGGEVEIVKGSEENIKLTTPIDVVIAESILRARSQREGCL